MAVEPSPSIKEKLSVFLDFLFPQKARVRKLEMMSPADFIAQAPRSDECTTGVISLFMYKDPLVATALWEVKYRKNTRIAKLLAQILHDRLLSELSDKTLFENFTAPFLVPIPASKERMRKHGYNQCELLAKLICDIDLNRNFTFMDPLVKHKETPTQTATKERAARQENIKNSFEVKGYELLRGRNVILLDDVTTTGSTLNEAMRVLKIAGVKNILAITVAH